MLIMYTHTLLSLDYKILLTGKKCREGRESGAVGKRTANAPQSCRKSQASAHSFSGSEKSGAGQRNRRQGKKKVMHKYSV